MSDDRLTLTANADNTVISLSGDLDVTTAETLESTAVGALNGGGSVLRLDLGGLDFADSTGLGVLVKIHHRAEDDGARLELSNTPMQIRRLMEITKLSELFNLVD